jgi:hypothetical protein
VGTLEMEAEPPADAVGPEELRADAGAGTETDESQTAAAAVAGLSESGVSMVSLVMCPNLVHLRVC